MEWTYYRVIGGIREIKESLLEYYIALDEDLTSSEVSQILTEIGTSLLAERFTHKANIWVDWHETLEEIWEINGGVFIQ